MHSQLCKSPYVDMGFGKEYKFWDWWFDLKDEFSREPPFANPNEYLDYFESIPNLVTGDITPNYCKLSADNYSHINGYLKERGYTVKVVFLMRDPVERLWSAMQHTGNFDGYKLDSYHIRSRYEVTIKNLDRVFDNVFYGFYETLFTKDLDRLIKFLDIPHLTLNPNKVYNSSKKGLRRYVDVDYNNTYNYCYDRFGMDCFGQRRI